MILATTTTDANGDYMFEGLLDGDYQVVVTDVGLVLDGYFLTSGLDEYPITVAGADLTDIDFGYIRDESNASIGDAVWLDENAADFGWIRSYTEENADATGYRPEPWHFRWYPERTRTPR